MVYWREESKTVRITLPKLLFFNKFPFLLTVEYHRLSSLGAQWVPVIATARTLSSVVAPEPQAGRLVPGWPYISHRGSLDEPWGRRLSSPLRACGSCTPVPHLPFPVCAVSKSLPCAASASPTTQLPGDAPLPRAAVHSLWVRGCGSLQQHEGDFLKKADCSLVLLALPQPRMTGAPHFWGLACGGTCPFVAASGHAAEKMGFAVSHWPGLKEKLLLPCKILSTQSLWEAGGNSLFEHEILLTSLVY